ncbi:unnamed protein product [Symbiodinium sp. KB8]|nr:unnamed protein product [Symbiodinium sp. KB8]
MANVAKQTSEARYEEAGVKDDFEEIPPESGDFPENKTLWVTPAHLDLLHDLLSKLNPKAVEAAFDTDSPSIAMVIVACALSTLHGDPHPSWEAGRALAVNPAFRETMAKTQPQRLAAALRCASRAILRKHPRHDIALPRVCNLQNEDLASRFGAILTSVPANSHSEDADPAASDSKSDSPVPARAHFTSPQRAARLHQAESAERVGSGSDAEAAPVPKAPGRDSEGKTGDQVMSKDTAAPDVLVACPEIVYPVFDLLHHYCLYNSFWRPDHELKTVEAHQRVLQGLDSMEDGLVGEYAGVADAGELANASDDDELAEASDSSDDAVEEKTEDEVDEEELAQIKVTPELMENMKRILDCLTVDMLLELSRVAEPTEDMIIIAGALCTLLNVPKPSWTTAKKVIRKKGFVMKLSMVHPSMLAPLSRRVAREILRRHPKHTLDVAKSMEIVKRAVGITDYKDGRASAAGPHDDEYTDMSSAGKTAFAGEEKEEGITATEAGAVGASFAALAVLHNWCLIMAYWVPDEDSNLRGMAGVAIDKEIVEIFREMGYKNPAEAAAAAAAAAAAEAADGKDIGEVLAEKGYALAPEHLEHFRRLFAGQRADRKERRRAGSPRGESPRTTSAASHREEEVIDSESDDEDVELSILRTKTPDEPPVQLREARHQLSTVKGADVAIMAGMDSTIQPLACFGACVCVLFDKVPEWSSAQELMQKGDDLLARMMNFRRADLSDRKRHYIATILGARRLLSMHYEKEYQTGTVLAKMLRWLVSLISDSRMRAQDIPLPRSARLSSVQYIDRVIRERKLERRRERNELARERARSQHGASSASLQHHALQSVSEEGHSDDERSKSLASKGSAASMRSDGGLRKAHSFLKLSGKSSRVLDRDGPPPKFPHRVMGATVFALASNNKVVDRASTIASRAALRSAAWRARMRLKMWKREGLTKTLLSRRSPLGWVRRGLLDVDRADLNAFRRQEPVDTASSMVGSAMCLLLGQKASWRYVCDFVQEPEIIDFFTRMEPQDVDVRCLALARAVLVHQAGTFNLGKAVEVSPFRFVHRFYFWVMVLTDPNEGMPSHGLGLEAAVDDAAVSEALDAVKVSDASASKEALTLRTMTRRDLLDDDQEDHSPVTAPHKRRASLIDTISVKNRARNKRGSLVMQAMTMDPDAQTLRQGEVPTPRHPPGAGGDGAAFFQPKPPPRSSGAAAPGPPPGGRRRLAPPPPMMVAVVEEEEEHEADKK